VVVLEQPVGFDKPQRASQRFRLEPCGEDEQRAFERTARSTGAPRHRAGAAAVRARETGISTGDLDGMEIGLLAVDIMSTIMYF
jgi:hypothetical protein